MPRVERIAQSLVRNVGGWQTHLVYRYRGEDPDDPSVKYTITYVGGVLGDFTPTANLYTMVAGRRADQLRLQCDLVETKLRKSGYNMRADHLPRALRGALSVLSGDAPPVDTSNDPAYPTQFAAMLFFSLDKPDRSLYALLAASDTRTIQPDDETTPMPLDPNPDHWEPRFDIHEVGALDGVICDPREEQVDVGIIADPVEAEATEAMYTFHRLRAQDKLPGGPGTMLMSLCMYSLRRRYPYIPVISVQNEAGHVGSACYITAAEANGLVALHHIEYNKSAMKKRRAHGGRNYDVVVRTRSDCGDRVGRMQLLNFVTPEFWEARKHLYSTPAPEDDPRKQPRQSALSG